MKLFLLLIPALLLAQDAKVASTAKPADAVQPQAKTLDKEVFYFLEMQDAKLEALGERYRINEYRAQAQAIVEARNKKIVELCAAVGIAEKEIEANCRVSTKEKEFPNGVLQWMPKPEPIKASPRVDSKETK